MLRVLHCIYDDPKNPWLGGGGAMRVFEIYRRLTGRVDVTVATGSFPGGTDEVIEGVRYMRLGASRPYSMSRWSYSRIASRLLDKGDYDVGIYDFSPYTPILIPRERPIGVVAHMLLGSTANLRWGPIGGPAVAFVERALLRRARWISTVSSWTASQIEPFVPDQTEIRVVGNAISDEFYQIPRKERDYLLYYGRFDVLQKGLDTLLLAMVHLVREMPDLKLQIAGRGKDTERIRLLTRDLGVEPNVHIHENVTREVTQSLFSGACLLVMPSRFEGLPIVAMEAMAAGIPIIATAVGGTPEVVEPPHGGVLIPPDNPNALATAVAELLANPERRDAMSLVARDLAERFSWSRIAEEHFSFLEDIAEGTREGLPVSP